jgi:hypothetical protein
VLSQTSSASGKSAGDSKFQTPSPGWVDVNISQLQVSHELEIF